MKRIIFIVLVAFLTSHSFAQINENFNTSPSNPNISAVKGFMQNNCWKFDNMDSRSPGLEGNGAMMTIHEEWISGIRTPVLDVPGRMLVNFKYQFDSPVGSSREFKIFLTNYNNEVVQELATVDVSDAETGKKYSYVHNFHDLPAGAYCLYIMFSCQAKVVIDQMHINVPLKYASGCNAAPVAGNDNIPGNANRTAAGNVFGNDYDPNGEPFTGYVINNSPDGSVVMNANGSFTFTPNPGFSGTSTSFTYQVCDNGFGPVCGDEATVTITFPAGMLPVKLSDFTVSLNDDNDAIVRWTTTYEQGSDRFEVERSFDGATFQMVGTVKAAGTSFNKNDYSFTDKLNNNTLNKKDVYYRLRLVDGNGRAEVTKVMVLRLYRTSALKMIAVSPNPVYNDINVQVQLKENSFIVMKITDSRGVEVSRKSVSGNQGVNVFLVDGTSKLKAGVYMLEVIINNKERMTTKLVKN